MDEKNPETAKHFCQAAKKGYEYAIEHPKDAGDILCEASPELDSKMVQASQKYMKDQYKAEVKQWGYINPERWNAFYNWISEKGLSKTKIPENNRIYQRLFGSKENVGFDCNGCYICI